MKKLGTTSAIIALAFGLGTSAMAADTKPKPKSPPAAKTAPATPSPTIPTPPPVASDKSARVIVLDKQTNRKQVLTMLAGESQSFGTLQIKLNKCMPDYAGVLGQDVAWLDVTESAEGTSRNGPWFAGWMYNTYPEISTLDHPRYDVQLQGCGITARQIIRATGAAPVLDSSPVEDTESAGDQPANDPYVVPGVKDETAPAAPAAEPTLPVQEQPAPAQPVAEPATPIAQPVISTPPAAAQPQAEQPQGDQQDLHKLMDNGTY